MSVFSLSNLKKTWYYLQKNGIRNAVWAVLERIGQEQEVYTWQEPDEKTLSFQREHSASLRISIVVPAYRTKKEQTLLKLNILLNTHLNGLSIDEINLAMISEMKQQAGVHSGIVSGVIDAVAEAIRSDEDLKIYTSGTNNILKYPELTDNREKTSELINVFEEKKALGELVQDSLSEENNTGIQVYIGNETPVSSMKDCSVVTATYELGEGMRGTIGIIGPKRMDYDKVIGTLKTLMNELDTLYKK